MKRDSPNNAEGTGRHGGLGALLAGCLAAILASTCCLGPLVLITLGITGAWISKLTLLEAYQPLFIGAAVAALFFAYRRILQPAAECTPGQVCARSSVNRSYKLLFWTVLVLVVLALGFPLIAPRFY